MDCLKGMQQMQPDSVDLILCDPPYGTIKDLGKFSGKAVCRVQAPKIFIKHLTKCHQTL